MPDTGVNYDDGRFRPSDVVIQGVVDHIGIIDVQHRDGAHQQEDAEEMFPQLSAGRHNLFLKFWNILDGRGEC